MNRTVSRIALVGLCALAVTGCFSVSHKLPPHAYFGTLPKAPTETSTSFERSAMKNWLIAGLVPWSTFSSKDLLAESASGVVRYENLRVKTEFTAIDTIYWFTASWVYLYYAWAPRHITVTGDEIRSGAAQP